jgi:hypothetical protein
MRKVVLVSALAGLALAVGFATPASADDTIVTVTVTALDGLTINAQPTANIGSSAPGTTKSGQLGTVTVLDERAVLSATWIATVISSDFITGVPPDTAAETIPNINVSYWSGPSTANTGGGTNPTAGQPTAGDAAIINVPTIAFRQDGGIGDNSATWNPTLVINIPATNIAGAYTGTVTHSVS